MTLNNYFMKMAEEGGLLGAAGGNATAGTPAAPSPVQTADTPLAAVSPFATTDWRHSLPQDIQDTGWIKNLDTPEAMAKSYANAQKMIGADKIVVPNQYATDQDWKNVWSKLGLPETVDKYEIKTKEGVEVDKDFFTSFKTSAHASGILPTQAQKMLDWFDIEAEKVSTKVTAEREAATKKGMDDLQKEYGNAYQMKLKSAQAVVDKFGDDAFKKHLADSGLANDPTLIKMFMKIGESFSEDTFKGTAQGPALFTPEAALKEANKIIGDMKHAYNDKKHPGHADAVKEVTSLFKQAHPPKS